MAPRPTFGRSTYQVARLLWKRSKSFTTFCFAKRWSQKAPTIQAAARLAPARSTEPPNRLRPRGSWTATARYTGLQSAIRQTHPDRSKVIPSRKNVSKDHRVWRAGLFGSLALQGMTMLGQAQFPTPPVIVPGNTWNSGLHHTTTSPGIRCPHEPEPPMWITNEAHAEFVSGTAVHLTEGFHAGGFIGIGQFHAYIGEGFGDPAALVLISPAADTSVVDATVQVPRWEKLELGLELPPVYQAAIDSFFTHYYSNGPEGPATPGMVDPLHDLNPYADDSLQLLMTLTRPSGTQTLKWGFFMREAVWENQVSQVAMLIEDTVGPLAPYNIRFRFAPDTVGEWTFSLSVKAPHTATPGTYVIKFTSPDGVCHERVVVE